MADESGRLPALGPVFYSVLPILPTFYTANQPPPPARLSDLGLRPAGRKLGINLLPVV
jgi:hypothetical protein